jgi:hypothetical protein
MQSTVCMALTAALVFTHLVYKIVSHVLHLCVPQVGEYGVGCQCVTKGAADGCQRGSLVVKEYYKHLAQQLEQKGFASTVWCDGGEYSIATLDSKLQVQWSYDLYRSVLAK